MKPARLGDDPVIIDGYKDVCRQFAEWTDTRLWLYDQQGTVNPQTIVAVTRYCAKELGIQHMFIDSLMKCVKGEDDYNGQKYLVDELCAIAKDHDCHIHLIHHIKKLASEDQTPGKFDAKGSGAVTDQVDNMLIHWRNKAKEAAYQVGKIGDPNEPDALLICAKQRNGEWEGRIQLWFDPESNQFLGGRNDRPVNFESWPHRPWS
jgi:twinkle protein